MSVEEGQSVDVDVACGDGECMSCGHGFLPFYSKILFQSMRLGPSTLCSCASSCSSVGIERIISSSTASWQGHFGSLHCGHSAVCRMSSRSSTRMMIGSDGRRLVMVSFLSGDLWGCSEPHRLLSIAVVPLCAPGFSTFVTNAFKSSILSFRDNEVLTFIGMALWTMCLLGIPGSRRVATQYICSGGYSL